MRSVGQLALRSAIATGKTAYGTGRALMRMPTWAKAGMLIAGAAGATVAARAFTPAAYQAEDHAVSDGMGGYEVESGVRRRAQSMNATGNLVFGLHAGRH